MKARWIPGAMLFAAAAMPVMAQESGLPPADAVDAALEGHPSVEAANARVAAARATAQGLRAGPHEFQASGSYIRREVDREGGYDEFDGTLSHAIRLPGKAALDRQAGVLGIEEAELRRDDARHQAALMLAGDWHDWLAAAAEARIDSDAVASHERDLKSILRRVELRDAPALEADQARVALGNAQAALAGSQGRERAARARLAARFPGLPLPATPPEQPDPVLPAEGLQAWRDLVITRSHEIGAARAAFDRQRTLADRARRDRIPDPTLGVRMFSERSGSERGAGLVFSMPLGGGQRRAAADQARAQGDAAAAELASIDREVRAAADADMIAAASAIDAWKIARDARASAADAARRLRVGYRMGGTDLADLLYAERQAIEAARAEISRRSDALRSLTKLRIDAHLLWMGAVHQHQADD